MSALFKKRSSQVPRDSLSRDITRDTLVLDEVARLGLGQVSAISYDAVQGLLGLATTDGNVFVYGQRGVRVVFKLPQRTSISFVNLHGSHLTVVDARSNLTTYSLESKERVAAHTIRSKLTCIETDPSLDWMFLGLTDGTVDVWDIDRERIGAAFRIPNLYRERHEEWRRRGLSHAPTKSRISPVVSMQFHPRDIGCMLIGYPDGAVLYSYKEGAASKFFELNSRQTLLHLAWHPNGIHFVTAHSDGSLAFWNPSDAERPLITRTVDSQHPEQDVERDPIYTMRWICQEDPDATSLIVCGGGRTSNRAKGAYLLNFGYSSSATASAHTVFTMYASPKKQIIIASAPHDMVKLCPIPTSSPYHTGGHNPNLVFGLLSNGSCICFSAANGQMLSMVDSFSSSISWLSPPIIGADLCSLPGLTWRHWVQGNSHQSVLFGGAPVAHKLRTSMMQNVLIQWHKYGIVRFTDPLEEEGELEVDVNIWEDLRKDITRVSLGYSQGELAVGFDSGDLVVFKWEDKYLPEDHFDSLNLRGGEAITNIRQLGRPGQGFQPICHLKGDLSSISTVVMSNIGFLAVGYESGQIKVVDMRGPAVILQTALSEVRDKKSKRNTDTRTDFPTTCEVAILSLEGDTYASIVLLVGSSLGKFVLYTIIPSQTGGYTILFHSFVSLQPHGRILKIIPIESERGFIASATSEKLAALAHGIHIPSFFVVIQETAVKIVSGGSVQALFEFKGQSVLSANCVIRGECSTVVCCTTTNSRILFLSNPDLQSITEQPISMALDCPNPVISPGGDVLAWRTPSECSLWTVWGRHKKFSDIPSSDLYDALKVPGPRPTISTLQWMLGTQYLSTTNFDILVGGPDRPLSKAQYEQERASEYQKKLAMRSISQTPSNSNRAAEQAEDLAAQKSYFAQMKQSIGERGEKLFNMEENFSQLEESSSNWMKKMSDYAAKEKRKALLGSVTKGLF